MGRRLRRTTVRTASRLRSQTEFRLDPTYRRLSRSYLLPDGSRRVYYYHVRKTAGTSLGFSFLALGGEDPLEVRRRISEARLRRTVSGLYAFAVFRREVLAEGAYFFGRSHRCYDDQPLPEGTFTVTVLRDPADRVHSYFDYLVAGDKPGMPTRLSARERRLVFGGFDAFLDRVPDRHLLNQVATFSKRLDVGEAADRIASCSSVLTTSDFVSGLADLGRRLDLNLTEHRARVTTTRSSLTDGQRDRLRARLEPEYELLRRLQDKGVLDPARRA